MSLQSNITPMDSQELKKVLQDIYDSNSPIENPEMLIGSMMKYIGSPESELRELIYTSFHRLIIDGNLDQVWLTKLVDSSLNELLCKGIGESGTDTVFTRAFTSLLVALILYRDNEENFLSESTIMKVKETFIHYLNQEKDLRGYVPEKGWAHSVAHIADAVDELVKNPKISKESYVEILKPLWTKIFVSDHVYIHDEENRVLTPILEMLHNGLDLQEIETMLQKIPTELKIKKEELDPENYYILVFNSKTFLKSFYMRLNQDSTDVASLQKSIEKCLTEI